MNFAICAWFSVMYVLSEEIYTCFNYQLTNDIVILRDIEIYKVTNVIFLIINKLSHKTNIE